jgi:metallo-beta-lactamase family protein
MELTFLGGASTVTGSRFLLTTARARVLIDCGMFQGSPNETVRNRVPLGVEPSELDAILVTHAHLDHCGLLPVVVRDGFKGRIYLTSATAELTEIVLLDSGRLQEEFAKRHDRWERRHPPEALAADREAAEQYRAALEEARLAEEAGHVPTSVEPDDELALPDPEVALREQPAVVEADLDEPLYTEDDAKRVMPLFESVRYGKPREVATGIIATFVDAGHILGSAIIHLEVRDTDGAEPRTIVFSGDLGRPNTPILRDPAPMRDADYLVVESTYGGREHEPSEEAVRLLAEVRERADAGGRLGA